MSGGWIEEQKPRRNRANLRPRSRSVANALIETSLPTVVLWRVNEFTTPVVAFGTWPTMRYFNLYRRLDLEAQLRASRIHGRLVVRSGGKNAILLAPVPRRMS